MKQQELNKSIIYKSATAQFLPGWLRRINCLPDTPPTVATIDVLKHFMVIYLKPDTINFLTSAR